MLIRVEKLEIKVCSFPYNWNAELTLFKEYRVGQVHVMFTLPDNADEHLAYAEWFSRFPVPHSNHGIIAEVKQFTRSVDVLVDSLIKRSGRLFSKSGSKVPNDWMSSNVLGSVPPSTLIHFYNTLSVLKNGSLH